MPTVDPKPLFDDDERSEGAHPRPVVAPLDLSDDPAPAAEDRCVQPTVAPLELPDEAPAPVQAAPFVVAALDLTSDPLTSKPQRLAAPIVAPAIAVHEHPYIASAMARGESLFPDLMRERGFQIRNLLDELIPVDFTKLANFADDTLRRVATLVSEVAELDQRFHQIDAERLITGIIERAKSHAANAKKSVIERLSSLVPFDEHAARLQIEAIRKAIEVELAGITDARDSGARLNMTLTTQAVALAILNDMSDRGTMGDVLARRCSLVNAAKQELEIAARQVEALQFLAQQWMMRCDEVRTVILPALGLGRI